MNMMHMIGLTAGVAVSAAVVASPAAGARPLSVIAPIKAPPPPRSPPPAMVAVGRWVVSGENNRCLATRQYGDASAPVTLGIRPRPMSDVQITLVEPATARVSVYETGGARFGLASADAGVNIKIVGGAGKPRVADFSVERSDLAQAVASKEIWLYSKSINRRIQVDGLKGVLDVLATCERQVIADNGMSISEQARMATGPVSIGNVATTARTDDYPSEAVRNAQQGTTMVRLLIRADGTMDDCLVVESSGWPALDAATCKVGKRVRFVPAKDRDGKPMQALFFYSLRWMMP